MRPIRITGLVKVADHFRRDLGQGLSPQQRDRWRKIVAGSLKSVREILQRENASVERLPAPSRRALEFLSSIQWDQLPTSDQPASSRSGGAFRWPGIGGYLDRIMRELAVAQEAGEIDAIHRSIQRSSGQMEAHIEANRIGPEQLTAGSREARGWLAFFADRENLQAYMEARDRAADAIIPAARAAKWRMPLRLEFRPLSVLFRARQRRDATVMAMRTPMIGFDASGFGAVADRAFARSESAQQRLTEALLTEAYQSVQAELESLGGIVERPRGAFHDLAASFERVNARFFGGRMARPHLTWSTAFTGRKFGHYDHVRDRLMVSATLDQAHVPTNLVDYLVYHELLHKHLGLRYAGGRAYHHTSEFRELEKRFGGAEQCEKLLGELARKGRLKAPGSM